MTFFAVMLQGLKQTDGSYKYRITINERETSPPFIRDFDSEADMRRILEPIMQTQAEVHYLDIALQHANDGSFSWLEGDLVFTPEQARSLGWIG